MTNLTFVVVGSAISAAVYLVWIMLRPKPKPELCQDCLKNARWSGRSTAYVYENGHMLGGTGPAPLSAWPHANKPRTYCGLPIYGMGPSGLYRLNA